MKKLFLLLILVFSLNVFGQNHKDADIMFYGVDFSEAKVYGASETYGQFKEAFHGINMLFLGEPKKYNVGKILGVNLIGMDLDPAYEKNMGIPHDEWFTTTKDYTLADEQIQDAIDSLPLKEENGTGLVIVAQLLNKANLWGTFTLVYFDIETREILEAVDTGAKPKGYGLRNFWARSVLDAIKKL